MTDEEYEGMVAEIMRTYSEDPKAAVEALEEIDTVLLEEPTITQHYSSGANTRGIGTDPTDYAFSVYSFKRGESNIYYLQWLIEANENEWAEGPYDLCSLEWDTAYASFYAASGDNIMTTVKDRDTGIVLFNIEDKKLGKGDYTYGTVQVSRKKSGWLDYGSKFTHTASALSATLNVNYQFVPSAQVSVDEIVSLNLSYTRSYTVIINSTTTEWHRWEGNSVYL